MNKIRVFCEGETVLEFESFQISVLNGGSLRIDFTGKGIESLITTKEVMALNPTHLEVIVEEECPEFPETLLAETYVDMPDKNCKCGNCADGMVEKIVGKYTFNPKDDE